MPFTAPSNMTEPRQLVDEHIRQTRRSLKIMDLLSGIITLVIGLLIYLLSAALLEHWIIPGGWSTAARTLLLVLLLGGVAWHGWLVFWPLIKQSINPLYVAKTIEQSSPSLKNSLLNLLIFRKRQQRPEAHQHLPQSVYQAIEQQAAVRLSQVQTDAAVDHSAVLRLGYALVAVVAVCALYRLLSPKDPIASAGRVLMPWSTIAAPSRVQILNLEPGDISVARGEPLTIQANILGLKEDEPVTLRYSTSDGQHARESIAMRLASQNGQPSIRYQCQLPDGRSAGSTATGSMGHATQGTGLGTTAQGLQRLGIQQDIQYWIEAGDAQSARYQIHMIARPTMVVERVRYNYPDYTGYPSREVAASGDIRALEGTQVTISALANYPIQRAHLDFEADGRHDVAMRVVHSQGDPKEGLRDNDPATVPDRATVTFPLALRSDRRTPRHTSYVLRFTTSSNRSNHAPPKYQIDVTPDYPPEISMVTIDPEPAPEGEILDVRLNQTISVALEASDPDFALADVRVVGQLRGLMNQGGHLESSQKHAARPLEQVLFSGRHTGRFTGNGKFTPRELGLKAGDILHYWAVARDNKTLEANVAITPQQSFRVIDSVPNAPDGNGQDPDPEKTHDRQPNEGELPGGSPADDPSPNEMGNNRPDSGPSEQGDRGNQGDQGENSQDGISGGPGDDSTSGDNRGDDGNSGNSGTGNPSQPSQGQDNPSGGNDSEAPDSAEDTGQQSADGSSNGEPGRPPEGTKDEPGTSPQREQTGQQSSEGSNHPSGQSWPHQGEQDGAPQEKVSSEGDDDGTAFERMADYLARQDTNQQDDQTVENSGNQPEDSGDQPKQERSAQGKQSSQDTPEENRSDGDNQSGQSPESQSSEAQSSEAIPEGGKPAPDQGSAGEGDQPEEDRSSDSHPGSPQARDDRPHDRHPADQQSQENQKDSQPASQSKDRDQSESSGQQGGDHSGGGKQGAGQQAEAEGAGSEGQQETADQGGGRAKERGDGEASSNSGNDQGSQADSEDQTDSKDQSESQPANRSGNRSGKAGDPSQGPPSQDPQDARSQADSKGSQPPEGESDTNSPARGGNANRQPPGGGGDGNQGSSPPEVEASEPGGDEANLDYARMQTDLVLNRLSDQLERHQIDEQMLDILGWDQQDLRRFVDRWNGLKSSAAGQDDEARAARQELDAALRSLGLRKKGRMQYRSRVAQDQLRDLQDAYQDRTPADLIERVRDYIKGTASGEEER